MLAVVVGIGALLYHFIMFPLILLGVASSRKEKSYTPWDEDRLPTIDLLIAAKNEASCLREKLDNSCDLDYPAEKLRIIVLANGCTDETVKVAESNSIGRITVLEFDDIGKTEAQNRAVSESSSDIVVFSDANTLYDSDALRKLIVPFTDPAVGVVSGRHKYRRNGSAADSTEGAYWNIFETGLKRAESRTGGLIGANGSIYALRRELYEPLPPDVISDFIEPLLISLRGYRTEYAPDAVAWEVAESNLHEELARKERIVRRSFSSLLKYPQLLDPGRSGRISWLIWSHKVLRWFAPFLGALALLGSLLRILTGKGGKIDYTVFGGSTILGFFALLGRGLGTEKAIPLLSHSYYLVLMLKAASTGVIKALRDGSQITWNHNR